MVINGNMICHESDSEKGGRGHGEGGGVKALSTPIFSYWSVRVLRVQNFLKTSKYSQYRSILSIYCNILPLLLNILSMKRVRHALFIISPTPPPSIESHAIFATMSRHIFLRSWSRRPLYLYHQLIAPKISLQVFGTFS